MAQTLEREEVRLGPLAAIPLGEGRAYQVYGQSIAVFRPRDGAVVAVQNECPHERGFLAEGLLGGGCVVCPMHAYKFSLATGECLTDPDLHLSIYRVRERGGQIYLTMT